MQNILICNTTKASTPYIIPYINCNIYSYEELCFFLYENIPLLEKVFIPKDLLPFLKEELKLNRLYKVLEDMIKRKESARNLILAIFSAKSYYNEGEVRKWRSSYDRFYQSPWHEREKETADCYMHYKKYERAKSHYEFIIKKETELEADFLSKVYYNLGVCCCKQFDFAGGKLHFLKANEVKKDALYLQSYFAVLQLCDNEAFVRTEVREKGLSLEEFGKIVDEVDLYKEEAKKLEDAKRLANATYHKQHGKIGEFYAQIDDMLSSFKEDYKREG